MRWRKYQSDARATVRSLTSLLPQFPSHHSRTTGTRRRCGECRIHRRQDRRPWPLDDNVAKLLFLGEAHRLKFNHFEDGKKRDDHGVTRGAGFEELNEAYGTGVASENLRAKLSDHLRDRIGLVLQFDAGDFLFAFENLLEDADEVDERDNEFSFRTFVVVEGLVRFGPDVFL